MLYTIEDKTLKAMGDAIRSYTGVLIETTTEAPEPFWSYDIEISGADMSGWTESTSSYSYTVVIPQKEILGDCWDVAKYLEYSFIYDNTNPNNTTDISIKMYTDETYVSGSYSTPIVSSSKYYSPLPYSYTGNTALGHIKDYGWWELRFNVPKSNFTTTDTITLHLDLWVMSSSTEYVTPKKYTPLEMVDEVYGIIDDFANAPTIPEELILTGANCDYACAGPLAGNYINMFGNTISTSNISGAEDMFKNNATVKKIPFDINFKTGTSENLTTFFGNCVNLKEISQINNVTPNSMSSMFYYCLNLREIPEGFGDNWDWSVLQTASYSMASSVFDECHSLRKIPASFLCNIWTPYTSAYSSNYKSTFSRCYNLDEVNGVAVSQAKYTTNAFISHIGSCYRLKNYTFQTNEDGTPKTAPWKNQVLDFTDYVGYGNYDLSFILNYNSGITADKQVKDDATYQALKDDADWFAYNINYSRYNHTSAVNTINSLPDCSATGTNTIKFTGAAGALTDGGAINTLTEEEIAVAAAKGWTVSLV